MDEPPLEIVDRLLSCRLKTGFDGAFPQKNTNIIVTQNPDNLAYCHCAGISWLFGNDVTRCCAVRRWTVDGYVCQISSVLLVIGSRSRLSIDVRETHIQRIKRLVYLSVKMLMEYVQVLICATCHDAH